MGRWARRIGLGESIFHLAYLDTFIADSFIIYSSAQIFNCKSEEISHVAYLYNNKATHKVRSIQNLFKCPLRK